MPGEWWQLVLCFIFKQRESVQLALRLLDEAEIRGYKLHVEVAKFQLKGEYDASKKKKKCKDYKKKLSQQQKFVFFSCYQGENKTSSLY